MKKKKSEYESILEGSDSIIFTKDLKGNYTYVNKQFTVAHGEPKEEIIGKNDVELYPEKFALLYSAHDQIIISENKPAQFNEEDPKRPTVHFITNKFPLFDNNGEIYAIGGIATDVSEKINLERKLLTEKSEKELAEKALLEKRLLNSLQKTESRLNVIIENNPDWIIIFDKDGTWLDHHESKLNPLADYIVKTNPIGKNITEILPSDESGPILDSIHKCINTKSIIKAESVNDRNQFFEEYYVPLSDVELMAIVRNITDRKSVELALQERTNELEQVNQQLIEFSYVLSHDLKAPLIVMKMTIDSLLSENKNEDINNNFFTLKNKINSMIQLVDGLLKYSELTYSKENENVPYEDVDCNEIVHDVIEALQPPDTFEIKIIDILPKISFYKIRIYQLFQNLISNAIKYNDKPSGFIEIASKIDNDANYCIFTVKDNGIGIPKEKFDVIFNLFSTLGNKTGVSNQLQNGVGLNIVKKIIESMHGKISVESELKVGTTFIFLIPISYIVSN